MSDLSPQQVLAQKVEAWLERREQDHQRRFLTPMVNDPEVLDLTHNDYLDLRSDAQFQAIVSKASQMTTPGAGASRLLGGEDPIFAELENAFNSFKGAPATLFFGSGFAGNEGLITSLSTFVGSVFSDQLIHASMIDGIRLSKIPRNRRHHYPHLDLATLKKQLEASRSELNLILTESVFSMDGDIPDLDELYRLAQAHRGILVVDEAHAMGVYGPHGQGFIYDREDIITVNTCGKGLGVQGALVSGPSWLRDLLINQARAFIFTTAPSPWVAAALKLGLGYIQSLNNRRQWLQQLSETCRAALKAKGHNIGNTQSHIIPLIVGDDAKALALAEALRQDKIYTKAIRPPTVPKGTARVRLSLHAGISESQLSKLIDTLNKHLGALQ